jgi:hypothetical protein
MTVQGFAGNRRIVDIGPNTGAFTSILAQGVVRKLVIDESQITAEGVANVPQGVLQYEIPNDGSANGFTTIFEATQGATLPIVLGSTIADDNWMGEIIGQPGQQIIGQANLQPSTTMIKIRSGSATGTSIIVTEYT